MNELSAGSIGATIRDARRRAGLTQARLADRLSVAQATVSGWERGQRDPSASMLVRIAAVTGRRIVIRPEPQIPPED